MGRHDHSVCALSASPRRGIRLAVHTLGKLLHELNPDFRNEDNCGVIFDRSIIANRAQ
jgi:hypothetical protein